MCQDYRAGGVADECRRASFVELFQQSKTIKNESLGADSFGMLDAPGKET